MSALTLVLALPFALTLHTVREPRPLITDLAANPTPLGYTWSLSLFILPVLVLACWLAQRRESRPQFHAFYLTAAGVALAGVFLDVAFGRTFFTFPNTGAVLGLHFPGWSFTDGWAVVLPVEELGFYLFGALAVLLVYVWGDEFWFAAYNVDDADRRRVPGKGLAGVHPWSILWAAVLFGAGWAFKKFAPGVDHTGFPGYLLFLTLIAFTPSVLFYPVARPFINWRAFSLAFLFILFLSLFWEAVLAVPYQWWGFQSRSMVGLFINGFCGLPIEEPLLWIGVTWAAIILYETISTWNFQRAEARAAALMTERSEFR